jgi:hypothetical protein
MAVRNQNCKIKSRLNSRNASNHSIVNIFSSCLLAKNFEISVYKAIILAGFSWAWKVVSRSEGSTYRMLRRIVELRGSKQREEAA